MQHADSTAEQLQRSLAVEAQRRLEKEQECLDLTQQVGSWRLRSEKLQVLMHGG